MTSCKPANLSTTSMAFVLAVIDGLAKHVISYPVEVGGILLSMFEHKIINGWVREDEVYKIVETIYLKQKKSIANKVCIKCAENGFLFLRSLYDSNQETE